MTTPATQIPSATTWRAIRWGFVALFGSGAGIHAVLAVTTPRSYDGFADAAFFNWTTDAWQNIFMAHPTLWALLLAGSELAIAVLLVRARRLGYLAVIVFHLALMLFGWGFWLWCVPALAFAVPAAWHAFQDPRSI
ncbi:hypothetical protein EV651_10976 [Kribbella sp. VKM Ac-2571]|uniref:hypothetical protein n=1 Tax=Kribbella sp. VKM Ac-2571 TaxID=2512222 RepID=UPI0010608442|nr:hypothetical protein [Kribbella sp. VKM Ac-2571]TDO58801.1 hypothetical protein EV651_10976 [Kribbella sp. VKM Ac-2571]